MERRKRLSRKEDPNKCAPIPEKGSVIDFLEALLAMQPVSAINPERRGEEPRSLTVH
jgi:hypothetical protein